MKYNQLGDTGLYVSELCLGGHLSGKLPAGTGKDSSRATGEDLTRLIEISALTAGYPRWMMDRQSQTRIPAPFKHTSKEAR